jgi:hypothetical protein
MSDTTQSERKKQCLHMSAGKRCSSDALQDSSYCADHSPKNSDGGSGEGRSGGGFGGGNISYSNYSGGSKGGGFGSF